jgi:hypothetical protein
VLRLNRAVREIRAVHHGPVANGTVLDPNATGGEVVRVVQ